MWEETGCSNQWLLIIRLKLPTVPTVDYSSICTLHKFISAYEDPRGYYIHTAFFTSKLSSGHKPMVFWTIKVHWGSCIWWGGAKWLFCLFFNLVWAHKLPLKTHLDRKVVLSLGRSQNSNSGWRLHSQVIVIIERLLQPLMNTWKALVV